MAKNSPLHLIIRYESIRDKVDFASPKYANQSLATRGAFCVRGQKLDEFRQYKRKGLSEMRPYMKGEDMSRISVSPEDDPETDMGMVARNPKNHADQWYVAKQYFDENLEPA